jgi:hypothetical protein
MKQYYFRKTKNKWLEIVFLCLYCIYVYITFLLYFSLEKEVFFGKLQKGMRIWEVWEVALSCLISFHFRMYLKLLK